MKNPYNVETCYDRPEVFRMPKPDIDLYESIMELGFNKYPERKKNYELFLASQRGEVVDHLPIKLDIENVSRCNFRCNMCQVSEWAKGQRAADLSISDFQKILDDQHGLIEIKLQGMGEPLMAAKPYFEMIKIARSRHIWVRSTVNASLLHLKDNYKKIIESDICELQVSIDGASPRIYEKIRRGGKFDRVKENCALLNDYARKVSRHRTRMWTVVQDDNFEELEDIVAFAAETGFARLTFSLDLTDWGQDTWRNLNDQIDRHRDLTVTRASALIELGKASDVDVTFWYVDEKYKTGSPKTICPWPFERAFVSSDMRVVPCCMIANPDIVDFGDAHNFASIWNSSTIKEFRRLHLKGTIPEVCKTCYGAESD